MNCHAELAAGTHAYWDSVARSVTCSDCHATHDELPRADPGVAGASAAREHERRKAGRETRTRERHPWVGELLLTLRDEPQHEAAFRVGAEGEAAVAESLERRTANSPVVFLHDRRMPGSRGNIDHIAVAPTGVYVIDAKNITGKVRVESPPFGKPKLVVNGRDRTKLIDGLDRQVAAVRAALNPPETTPVIGVLCFTKADLPLLGTLKMRAHLLVYRKALSKRLFADGPFTPAEIQSLANVVARALGPA